ncbi:hypothetical protein BPAE_0018g00230 [Botrytis paeoniae]|uniref:NADP-dependent oxidoreductase domain-containing protein n=1 Tax=Botrytis paeoniae TaxID=278948 RepID=A0A4Z1G4U8_9HELO|nr:hypothetical protein BPAE_0018g00230 [Botrytis paeoniae]
MPGTPPFTLFGGASFGEGLFATTEYDQQLLALLVTLKVGHIDTAAIYPLRSQGKSEQLLGESHADHSFAIDTKIKLADFSGEGSFTASAINESVAESSSRIKAKVKSLFCPSIIHHSPQYTYPLDHIRSMYCIATCPMHQPRSAKRLLLSMNFISRISSKKLGYPRLPRSQTLANTRYLGISNFSVAQVQERLELCEKEGYTKPSYYQGQYNALCREAETQLLPILRQQKISYIAHRRVLTGIFTLGTDVTGTRFEYGNPKGVLFKRRYDNEPTHSAMKESITLLQPYDITPLEAALRWVYYHSALQEGDGVILGASKPAQISLNAADIAKGPLPSDVAEAMEKMWTSIQAQM